MFPFAQIGHTIVTFSDSLGRARLMAEMAELSDAQLTERGLTRQTLAQQVYTGK